MLKKVLLVLVIVLLSALYLSSNSLFFLEEVKVVKGEKSKGTFLSQVNYPFVEKAGIYKSFDVSYDCRGLIEDLSATLVCKENLKEVTTYYFYSKSLSKCEIIKGQKVNLQIAVSQEKIVIGTPIIYGGY